MGEKRKYTETGDVHPSRQGQVPGNTPKPAKKFHRSAAPIQRKPPNATSVNDLKRRIRDLKRRIERRNLPANFRVEYERGLVTLKQDLETVELEKFRQKMIKRYHMVRFFERQKATRMLKKLRKRLETESVGEIENIKAQIHVAEVDLNYTQYYPLCERYISLYAQKAPGESKAEGEDGAMLATSTKPLLWQEVERRMADATLDLLRNRTSFRLPTRAKIQQPTLHIESTSIDANGHLIARDNILEHEAPGRDRGPISCEPNGPKEAESDSRDGYESHGGFFEE